MKVPPTARTAEVGVAIVQLAVQDELGWLFREQAVSDYGVDAHIEVVESGRTGGRLLAVQIKSGASYLKERHDDGFVFRPSPDHVEYWLSHSLPVVVVLVDTTERTAWWQSVSHQTVVSSGLGWKMTVPFAQRLDGSAVSVLAALSEADPYTLKLRQLQSMASWMRLLRDGGQVALEMEEWVNKTSGRASLRLTGWNAKGEEIASTDWPFLIFPWADYAVELPRLFPWAVLSVDEDDDYMLYEEECAVWDDEGGGILMYSEDYGEWRRSRGESGLRASSDNGEVALWRLDVALGALGEAFLTLDELLAGETSLMPLGPPPST